MSTLLHGITWDHTRGYLPMIATSQRFYEMNHDIEVVWEKRSLQAFADYPLDKLIERYDLLVIDHPWVGEVSRMGLLLPLDKYLLPAYLTEQKEQSVGRSFESYQIDGHQWALAIDAATPVAAYRPDLINKYGVELPQDWEDIIDLARKGFVILPAKEIDLLMHFYMLVKSLGRPLFQDDCVTMTETGLEVLEKLRELIGLCPDQSLLFNPIQVYETMASEDSYVYCPFGYGYVNYSWRGYSQTRLEFCDLVVLRDRPLVSVLGGTGLAISSRSSHVREALRYAEYVARPSTQLTVYTAAGGQPGTLNAWTDTEANRLTSNFFVNTLPTLERAYVRPRYPGYLMFQDHAGSIIRSYIHEGGDPNDVLDRLNTLYRASKGAGTN